MNSRTDATASLSLGRAIGIRVSAVFWFVLLAGFLLALPLLLDIGLWLPAAVAGIALLLAVPVAWLLRLVAGRRQAFAVTWLKSALLLLFLFAILLAAPLYYLAVNTETRPLTMPRATLSNGEKTVVFQGMMHVGSEGFYKSVVYDLEKALTEGYVLYYEGVQPSTPEGDAWFSENLAGGGDLSENYQQFARACGLSFQLDYFSMLAEDIVARPARHVTADVNTLQMKREYERIAAGDPAFAAAVTAARADVSDGSSAAGDMISSFLEWQKRGTEGQKKLAGIACRGLMTITLSPHSGNKKAKSRPLDRVVLDLRNRELAKRIIADENKRIYITYGANHLRGVLDLLRQADPNWSVKSLQWMRAIETPQELDGEL